MNRFAAYPSLTGKSVVITGGASGIGAAIVEHFARQGARTGFIDIDAKAGNALAARLKAEGHAAAFASADLTDITALSAALAALERAHGPTQVLVNNAGHDDRHDLSSVSPDYFDERIAVNLRHQFFAAQAVAPAMRRAKEGAIINLGSTSWRLKVPGMPVYLAAKAAIEGLTRALARDLGADNIRVNCVVPGWVMTERQLTKWVTAEGEAEIMRNQCLPEKILPDDVARMVLFLAADDSRMVTAQNFVVDGGWT